ncbi:hypothetical protein C4D60_Mb01t19900 [Musa balbisiana]|uniref:Uncharacterized protein n=1 Tax=Musa balbisiana TaxID=52838 RepID=A0A4S8JNF7_MUSBA|nr:hypothetical protein C4D60_Mb01t19900 [Musa balbisiana]
MGSPDNPGWLLDDIHVPEGEFARIDGGFCWASQGFNSSSSVRLVTDIPETLDASHGNEIVSYESPRPQAGIHRIALVLFRQQVQQTVHAPGWRQNFSTRDFSAFHNLGLPAAATFFNCQRESGCGGRR